MLFSEIVVATVSAIVSVVFKIFVVIFINIVVVVFRIVFVVVFQVARMASLESAFTLMGSTSVSDFVLEFTLGKTI